MDTSYYHNFITLVQTGNMTQAAEILHITQPALSKQLKYLEAEFGAQLINIKRGQRGSNLQLTDAGKIFYEKAQQLCSIEESTYNAVQQLNSRIEGTLRIATSASRSTPIVQQYLPAFSMKYPSVHFEIYEGLMTNVVTQLINGSAELGIANIQMVDVDKLLCYWGKCMAFKCDKSFFEISREFWQFDASHFAMINKFLSVHWD